MYDAVGAADYASDYVASDYVEEYASIRDGLDGPSRKRARAASGSNSDDDDDTLSDDSGPPQTKAKVEVEEIGGFSIMSSASDLKHTACGLVQHGAPTS